MEHFEHTQHYVLNTFGKGCSTNASTGFCPVKSTIPEKKTPVLPTKAELHPLPPVMMNERWAMDVVGPLPLTLRGNRYILTFTEYNSRYFEALALQNTQAATIARVLVDEICFRYSAP